MSEQSSHEAPLRLLLVDDQRLIRAGFAMMLSQPLPADFLTRGGLNASGFIATLSLGVIWQLSFSPYTSDYSR